MSLVFPKLRQLHSLTSTLYTVPTHICQPHKESGPWNRTVLVTSHQRHLMLSKMHISEVLGACSGKWIIMYMDFRKEVPVKVYFICRTIILCLPGFVWQRAWIPWHRWNRRRILLTTCGRQEDRMVREKGST